MTPIEFRQALASAGLPDVSALAMDREEPGHAIRPILLSGDVTVKNIRSIAFLSWALLAAPILIPAGHAFAQQKSELAVMPLPAHVAQGEGEFLIDGNFGVALKGYDEPRLARAKQRFLDILTKETGIPFQREAVAGQLHFIIQTGGPSATVQQLGEDESYHLAITTTGVALEAPNPLGVLRGLQTFLQLVRINARGFSVPVVTIDDTPRFPWRGLLIDAGHRFVPIDAVKRNLDAMEAVKLNVLHWRFADDQGFHIESRKFPLLQGNASSGLYYSQDEVREIVQYARDRGIRVVPEFDMPCHTKSWFQGYPDLSGGSNPSQSSAMDPSRESTYKFLEAFIGEMSALFPDSYFHTGGDECDMKEWETNPRVQDYMRGHLIKDGAALQVQFTARIEKIVSAHNKIMVGWDEVLQPNTPKDVVIQSWRGLGSLADAARNGNRGVLSSGYYLDLNQSAAEHYTVDPLGENSAALTPEQKSRVLGGEAAMWTDIVAADNMDNRIWPRTAAIAERLWSTEQTKDVESMYARLAIISQKLAYYGPRHRIITEEMLERMSGDPNPESLRVLAAVVQPPRMYERQQLRSDFNVLNRLDDAVSPESETARAFDGIVQRISSGTETAQDWQQARAWLELWRDNDSKLQPMLKSSYLTQDLALVSTNLSRTAEIGLQALAALHEHHSVDAEVKYREMDFLESAAKPQAVLLLMPVWSVEKLVQACKTE